jgi:hypothetical protein
MPISLNKPYRKFIKFHENAYTFMNSLNKSFINDAMKLVCHSATDFTANKPAAGSRTDMSHIKLQLKHKKSNHTAKLSIIKWFRATQKMKKKLKFF